MIGFVEKGARQQLFSRLLVELAIHILSANGNFARARDVLAKFGNAQAAFVLRVTAFGVDDLGIRQHQLGFRIFFEGHVDDRQALGDADLRRSQADAVRGVHRLEHVVDEFLQFVVEDGHRLGALLQHRIAKFYDGVDHSGFRGSVLFQLLQIAFKIAFGFQHGVAAEFLQGARASVRATMDSAATPAAGTTHTSERS